jgi:glycosyltransferase involved in cell wall biosynthesis
MLKKKGIIIFSEASVKRMKDILLINNKSKSTGIGRYSCSLYENLRKITARDIDLVTLGASFKEENGSAIKTFSQSLKKLMNHMGFASKAPRGYKLYHLLNPNLGIMLVNLHPSVVTVHDLSVFKRNVVEDIIAESYGLEIPQLLAIQLNMRYVRDADRVLCMSNYTKNDVISVLGVESKRITVTYPGIDHELFKPRDKLEARRSLGLPLKKPIVLHVGTDEPRKNTKTLIEALASAKQRIPDLILVKVGGIRKVTCKLISALGLSDSVIHFERTDNVALFYNAADLFAFPSYYEGFGYPAAEAMASGCPVVAANSSSLTEVVGEGGVLFPTFDVTALREIIIQMLTDPAWEAALVREGLEQVKKFDWKNCAKMTLGTYETLL